jgi:hypothetical protein
MKGWIAAAALTALMAAGSIGTVEPAAAAKVITVPRATHLQIARHQRDRATVRPYGEPYYAGGVYYYARPFFYIPAPFPLGVDFGFGW